jgi:hypothetical protein
MVELLACDLESFWGKPAGLCRDWWACGGDVVSYVVLDG